MKYQKEILGGVSFENGVLPYLNPPIVAMAFFPLSYFSLTTAYYIWALIQLGLLTWLMFLINRLFSHWNKLERAALILTILAFYPLVYTLILGQFTLIILLGIIQIYMHLKDSKYTKAGLWFIPLIVKPQFALIPGMITLNKRLWKTALAAILGGLAINIIPLAVFGLQPYIQYFQLLKSRGNFFSKNNLLTDVQYTIRGILLNLFGQSNAVLINSISITLLVVSMIFVWWRWWHQKNMDNSRIKLYFSITITLACLVSIHSNPYDSLLLILPSALFYDYLRELKYPTKAYSVILLTSPMIFFISSFIDFKLFGIFAPPTIVILILLTWMIYYLMNEHPQEQMGPAITDLTN